MLKRYVDNFFIVLEKMGVCYNPENPVPPEEYYRPRIEKWWNEKVPAWLTKKTKE